MSATIVLLLQMRRISKTFHEAGATNPAAAIVPGDYGIRQSFAFRRLVRRGVLLPVGTERFYLNDKAEQQYTNQRRFLVFVLLTILLVGLLLLFFSSR